MKIHCSYDQIVKIEDLKPHPKNANQHSGKQISRFCKILEYQGIRRPVRVSKLSGYVTSGHGLIAALQELRVDSVPVNYQEYESEEQEFADIVADNAIASWSELDLSAINLEIPSMGPDFDIDCLGLKDFKIDAADNGEMDECPTCHRKKRVK